MLLLALKFLCYCLKYFLYSCIFGIHCTVGSTATLDAPRHGKRAEFDLKNILGLLKFLCSVAATLLALLLALLLPCFYLQMVILIDLPVE